MRMRVRVRFCSAPARPWAWSAPPGSQRTRVAGGAGGRGRSRGTACGSRGYPRRTAVGTRTRSEIGRARMTHPQGECSSYSSGGGGGGESTSVECGVINTPPASIRKERRPDSLRLATLSSSYSASPSTTSVLNPGTPMQGRHTQCAATHLTACSSRSWSSRPQGHDA